ncbi:hypothetical protein Pta02_77920 [Planobispora takensis]|uniref:Uncharacterized protein n=2 Tax=Planobispora takensis TaxID=1367882 RepID=A0A8J3WX89_9ACTN|nr:hypothetical protein Pta02_77920 [Planobispora takensis]
MDTYGNSQREIPTRITLLRPSPGRHDEDQLFLDQLPIPRDAWSYDPHDRMLTWGGAYGGGHLQISHDGLGGYGNIGSAVDFCSVTASARAQFTCDVALNCGASYESSGGSITGMKWDTASAEWTNANWIAGRLLLTYTVTPGGPLDPPTFTFEFQDNETRAIPWDPQDFVPGLTLEEKDNALVWFLSFKSNEPPMPDRGPKPPTGPDSVYPLWLQAFEDSAAATINGVMEIDKAAPSGTLVGIRGVRATPLATGYYQVSAQAAPFGVFDGRLVIGGSPVADARLTGGRLRWSGLSAEHSARTGLPRKGSITFSGNGSHGASEDGAVRVRRLGQTAALAAIARHSDLHRAVRKRADAMHAALAGDDPQIKDLLAMTPFAQNSKGEWGDAVQAAVAADLSTIMNSRIDGDLWKLLYPTTPQPTVTGELARVANSPVPGVSDPAAWYRSLGTAVMTQGLADGSDPNCRNLNGPRAAAWLKTEVAASQVYYRHGQMLFGNQWQARCPNTSRFLTDQQNNTKAKQGDIQAKVTSAVADINANVAVNGESNDDLKAHLIADVTNAGQYAIDNNLYWAFAFYNYNVAPSLLTNIALAISGGGSGDGTALSRLFQQNVAVLTALDPSGYFPQRYTGTINTFLATNILPSMFGFTDDPSTFTMIKKYLEAFRDQNLDSQDKQIADVAAQLAGILSDAHADEMLHDWIEAIRSISNAVQDTLALPYVANSFTSWFSENYPRFSTFSDVMGSLLIGGMSGLAVFNLFSEFKSYGDLKPKEQASLITNTAQLGLQIISAMVKRGVRIYSIFSVEGMTAGQRTAAISKIIATGEADVLDRSLVRIGNSTARWLADTEGTVGKLVTSGDGGMIAVMVTDTTAAVEDATLAAKVLGRNLDEFIATRIGPLFILAGIGFSIWSIATGESGIALASDILNIVSGSLMLFATVGGWLVAGEVIAAESVMATIFTIAGPLAIVVALAGVGLMLYELFNKPADPVEDFVNKYAKPAGFYVSSSQSAIDYARAYVNPDENKLLMVGFVLNAGGQAMQVASDGSVRMAPVTSQPDCVWQAKTDGYGMTTIFTIIQPDPAKPPITAVLSMMSDGTVSFQPPASSTAPTSDTAPTVVTQIWAPVTGNASLTTDGKYLASMPVALQAMQPPAAGTWPPTKPLGWLSTQNGIRVLPVESPLPGTVFQLVMTGMSPNYMRMTNISFPLNSVPSPAQTYGPSFGVLPSTPLTYTRSGDPLPAFLTFDSTLGTITPNGGSADQALAGNNVMGAQNVLGAAQAAFTITVSGPSDGTGPADETDPAPA